jgi:hypothetical protein
VASELAGKLERQRQKYFGEMIFQGFDHHKQMGNQFKVNSHTFILTGSFAEGRDLNRHRAWGRFMPMLSAESEYYSNLKTGYTLPMYLSDNPELAEERAILKMICKIIITN